MMKHFLMEDAQNWLDLYFILNQFGVEAKERKTSNLLFFRLFPACLNKKAFVERFQILIDLKEALKSRDN